jgi:hypothetical protein
MRILVAVVALAMMAVSACGSGSSDAGSSAPDTPVPTAALHLADDSVITYQLQDSSVPPEFHRSVTVTVTKATTRVVIDSYGDVLADRSTKTPDEVWAMLDAGMPEAATMVVNDDPKGCTGGTGRALEVVTAGQKVVDIQAEFCGGSNSGLDTRIDLWITPARALFPTTDEMAPRGA